jgi:hypothetical protein
MNYNIVQAINDGANNAFFGQERYYVTFAEGPATGTRENIAGYDTEEKAKRRIRDLKRKEAEKIEAAAHCENVAVPAIIDPPWFGKPLATETRPVTPAIVRQVGCYPAISKHAYRR